MHTISLLGELIPGAQEEGPTICAKTGSPKAHLSVGFTQVVSRSRYEKLPPPLPTPLGQGSAFQPSPAAQAGSWK